MHALAVQGFSGGGFLGFGLIWAGVVAAYWLPTLIVIIRRGRVPSMGSVIVVNALLGWTLVGWMVALAMAFRDERPPPWPYPQQPPPPGWPPQQGRGR